MSERFLDDVKGLLNAEPFTSFQLILTSGTVYQVLSPLQLVPQKSTMTFYFARSNRIATFRINQIVSVETLEERPGA